MGGASLFTWLRHGRLALALAAIGVPTAQAAAEPAPPRAAFADQAKERMVSDPAAAYRLAQAAERSAATVAVDRDRRIAVATAKWLQGEASVRLNDADRAAPLIRGALVAIAPIREPIKLRGDLLLSRGGIQSLRAQAAEALASYQLAYKIFGAVGEKRSQSIALQSIAALYAEATDFASSEKYFKQAADAYQGDPMLSLSTHNNRGTVLLQMEKNREANDEFGKALAIARKLDSPMLVARILTNRARALIALRQLDEADRVIAEGFTLTRANNARAWEPQLLAIAAESARVRGRLPEASRLIERSFAGMNPAETALPYRDAHLTAYHVYRGLGNTGKALVHLEALRRLGDEAAKVASSTNAALMSARFDYANQELRIANLQAEELRRNVEFQRILFGSLGAAALIVLGLLTFGVIKLRNSRNQIRAANIDLAATNIALEKALKAKTEFLATTSHEIRTPLNGILGMTQVMLHDPKLAADMRDRIGIVHGAGMTMRALVDDILDVAKMETGNLTVEIAPLDLPATLREATRMWEEQARAKGLGFTLDLADAPGWVQSDPGRLRQIVFNLLSNAIKFTESGAVTLRAEAAGPDDARRLRLAFTDSGIGIPRDKCEEIFESFKQVDAGTTRRFGGTGLGLSICRSLARALGGEIHVSSVEGEGSTFTVDLPLLPAEAPVEQGPPRPAGVMLVLDRNPIARAMLKTWFEPHVGKIVFAATVDEARTLLEAGDATRLLVDEATLKAGEGDPFEALAALAAIGIPAAILWAKPDEAILAALKNAGVAQVVAKPVAGPALIAALFPPSENNSASQPNGPLVSRAA
jgi:signal transduction histidine kinase/CheY-like chemotaxis protein